MELVEISVGYDYQVLARHKRKRDAQWTIANAVLEAAIPSVTGAEAPAAGMLHEHASGFIERYRIWNGRLYREANAEPDPGHTRRHAPLTLEEVLRRGPLREGNLGRVPWKWLEKDVVGQFGAVLAEIFEDRSAQSTEIAAVRARDLVIVDGVLYVPSDPPMLSVSYLGRPVTLLTGAEMESSDPEFSSYSNHYTSLFRADRLDAAIAYAVMRETKLADAGQINYRHGPPERPDRTLTIEPVAEQLFLIDDMIESARRNMLFACWFLRESIGGLDGEAIRAFGTMRQAVLAMERPEGRTRGNARKAYEAMCAILDAGPGGWTGAANSQAEMAEIERNSGHLRDRYRTDPDFAPNAEETLAPADDAALGGLGSPGFGR